MNSKGESGESESAAVDKTIRMSPEELNHLSHRSKSDAAGDLLSPDEKSPAVVVFEKNGDSITRTAFHGKLSVHELIIGNRFSENDEAEEIETDEPTLNPPLPDINDNFFSLKTVARGGQGKIVLYEDKTLGRKVAVKSLLSDLEQNRDSRKRFIMEARVTSQLDHPSIPPVHGLFGDSCDRLYMAMKMIDGMTLSEYLEQVKANYANDGVRKFDVRKDLFERLNIFRRACFAVEYAHEHNMIHRDLKPDNIMIGKYNETYVMDWGIALTREQVLEKKADSGRKVAGTLRFLPPEVLSGDESWKDDEKARKYGWRSADIYALGLILFEIVTLSRAYEGKSDEEYFRKIVQGEMAPVVNRFGCRIDRDLKAIIRKASAPDLRRRYHHVEELDDDIEKYLRGEEVSARRDNTVRKVIRWSAHHTHILWVAVLGALLLASCVTTAWIYTRLTEQRLAQRISLAASEALKIGDVLDRRFDQLDIGLWMLGIGVKDLLTTPGEFPTRSLTAREIGTGPGNFSFTISEPDPDYVYYLRPAGLSEADAIADLHRLKLLKESFMRFVLESDHLGQGGDLTEMKQELRNSELLVARIFIGLRDGLFIVYPRNLHYPQDFDPRKRCWYQNPAETSVPAGTPFWLGYQDVSSKRWTLTARIIIRNDATGLKYGVMAFDIPVQNIYLLIHEKIAGRRPCGVLLDEKGRIVPANGGAPGRVHPAFREIQKREYGRYVADDGTIYLFAKLRAPGWYYVETFCCREK